MTTVTARRPIMDATGKVQAWLDAGRGVTIWTNQEIGSNRPDVFTPGDQATRPHWAYRADVTLMRAEECLFYAPGRIVKSWLDGPAGERAARKALAAMPDATRIAPIGRVFTTYTLHRFTLGSITIRPESEGGTTLDTYGMHKTLTHVEFRVGIREWTAIEEARG